MVGAVLSVLIGAFLGFLIFFYSRPKFLRTPGDYGHLWAVVILAVTVGLGIASFLAYKNPETLVGVMINGLIWTLIAYGAGYAYGKAKPRHAYTANEPPITNEQTSNEDDQELESLKEKKAYLERALEKKRLENEIQDLESRLRSDTGTSN